MAETTLHIGRKISRIRELRGMKQETLAAELGISQQAVSKMEQNERVEEEVLEKVAKALGVSSEVIKNFREESIFANYIYEQNNTVNQIYFQFNPIEKVIELYERLLGSEREKIDLLKDK
jgi:transcriptional regulator with XRE-family HTH domain